MFEFVMSFFNNSSFLSNDEEPYIQMIVENLPSLTEREWEIVKELVHSATASAIAQKFVVQKKTVDTHISNIYRKVGLEGIGENKNLRPNVLLIKAYWLYQGQNGHH